jgi:cell division protein FtsA
MKPLNNMDMEKDKIIVGLDIGTTKICAIVGRKNQFGKLEVLGMGKAASEGVTKGVVVNIDRTVAAITKAIKEAGDQSMTDISVVNVGIAGQHIRSYIQNGGITRSSHDEEISIEDLKRLTDDMYRLVLQPGNEIIHVMPQDYTVDYEPGINDPVGMQGVRLEADFHIITAHTSAINNINKCVRRAGMEVDELILEPLASSLSVLNDDEKMAGVCLVDIGGGTTDVAIFHKGIIRHTAVIPFGGNIITSDIQEGLMVLANNAETLKRKFGKAIADEASANEIVTIPGIRNRAAKEITVKNLAKIIEARMEEIIEMVHTEIISSGYEKKLGAGIVITGGGAQLHSLKQLVEFMTGIETKIGYPNEHMGKSKFEEVKSPMYATAVGLALAGFKCLDEREESRLAKISEEQPKSEPDKTSRGRKVGNLIEVISDGLKRILVDRDIDNGEYKY